MTVPQMVDLFDSTDITAYLLAEGVGDLWPGIDIRTGVADSATLNEMKDRAILITPGVGPGFSTSMHIDRTMWTLRCIGQQRNAQDGQSLALQVDRLFLADRPTMIGRFRSLGVWRAGSRPTYVLTDAARRAHYTCSYVIPVASGL